MDTLQVQKIQIAEDKMSNSIEMSIKDENHTLGNILSNKLQSREEVLFAAYKIPHPLQNILKIKVTTESNTSPIESVKESLEELIRECESIAIDLDRYN
ncbi:DNA-directed RNA polymerase II subunit RPB11 [Nematocida sp. AWRm80]|nr:DNA-directed RNA polymerase II subunit RPB11 [Nematocida sp. AWRm80]